jgi:hypothetical protein
MSQAETKLKFTPVEIRDDDSSTASAVYLMSHALKMATGLASEVFPDYYWLVGYSEVPDGQEFKERLDLGTVISSDGSVESFTYAFQSVFNQYFYDQVDFISDDTAARLALSLEYLRLLLRYEKETYTYAYFAQCYMNLVSTYGEKLEARTGADLLSFQPDYTGLEVGIEPRLRFDSYVFASCFSGENEEGDVQGYDPKELHAVIEYAIKAIAEIAPPLDGEVNLRSRLFARTFALTAAQLKLLNQAGASVGNPVESMRFMQELVKSWHSSMLTPTKGGITRGAIEGIKASLGFVTASAAGIVVAAKPDAVVPKNALDHVVENILIKVVLGGRGDVFTNTVIVSLAAMYSTKPAMDFKKFTEFFSLIVSSAEVKEKMASTGLNEYVSYQLLLTSPNDQDVTVAAYTIREIGLSLTLAKTAMSLVVSQFIELEGEKVLNRDQKMKSALETASTLLAVAYTAMEVEIASSDYGRKIEGVLGENSRLFSEVLDDFNSMRGIIRELGNRVGDTGNIDDLKPGLMDPQVVERVKNILKLSRGFSHEIIMSQKFDALYSMYKVLGGSEQLEDILRRGLKEGVDIDEVNDVEIVATSLNEIVTVLSQKANSGIGTAANWETVNNLLADIYYAAKASMSAEYGSEDYPSETDESLIVSACDTGLKKLESKSEQDFKPVLEDMATFRKEIQRRQKQDAAKKPKKLITRKLTSKIKAK